MPAKQCYKPATTTIPTITAKTVYTTKEIATSNWNLALIYGTAKSPGGTAIPSAAVVIWRNSITTNAMSLGNAYAVTFSDAQGRYGITIPTGDGYRLRVYGATS